MVPRLHHHCAEIVHLEAAFQRAHCTVAARRLSRVAYSVASCLEGPKQLGGRGSKGLIAGENRFEGDEDSSRLYRACSFRLVVYIACSLERSASLIAYHDERLRAARPRRSTPESSGPAAACHRTRASRLCVNTRTSHITTRKLYLAPLAPRASLRAS